MVTARENETVIIDPHLVELKGMDAMGIDFEGLVKEAGRREAKIAVSNMDSLHKKLQSATKLSDYSSFAGAAGAMFIFFDSQKFGTFGALMLLGGSLFTIIWQSQQSSLQKKIDKLKGEYNIPLSLQTDGRQIFLSYQLKL